MFYFCSHNEECRWPFDFGAVEEMTWVRDQLRPRYGNLGPVPVRTPIGQLVKSSISGRTRDEISLAAYRRLVDAYREWPDLARASAGDVQAMIGDVTFPDVKARHLCDALHVIAAYQPSFDLTFLGSLSVAKALAWLERLPGVGRKVSASTLNFSTLKMPAFVVDTHILRILGRYGFVQSNAGTRTAYDAIMATLDAWSADELAELHILMKRLGQTICRADLACCPDCPIRQRCRAAICSETGRAAQRERGSHFRPGGQRDKHHRARMAVSPRHPEIGSVQ